MRKTLASVPAAMLAMCLMAGCTPAAATRKEERAVPEKMWVYIGGGTDGKGGGIHRFELEMATGKLTPLGVTSGLANPSFLGLHPTGRFLYAVNEVWGKEGGTLSAFAIDPASGDLTFLNKESSGAAGPCHLVVDAAGKNVLAANYGGGSVCVLPIGADGTLGKATASIQHTGHSVDPKRQKGPHAHSINLDAANRFAFAADLGLDKILIYRFDPAKGTLAPNDPPHAKMAPGAGPRHFAFHPGGRFAYVINEMGSTVTAFAYDAAKGALTEIQTVTTLPEGFKGESWTAEVQVHPSGKFLYGSNRGHNSIAIFAVDPATGKLTPRGHESVRGDWPRNFGIDPTGTWLIAANKKSSNLAVFRIDPSTGALALTGAPIALPAPVCVKMLPKAR